MNTDQQNATIIAALNDRFRHTFWGGQVMTTCGVNELSDDKRAALFNSVRDFDNFVQDNDPHGEHNFRIASSGIWCQAHRRLPAKDT